MADLNGKSIIDKKRLSINLSLFILTETPTKSTSSAVKSPKNFEEPGGVVGLGIVAAMNGNSKNECNFQDQFVKRAAVLAVSPKSSNPIPILSDKKSISLSANSKRSPACDSNANIERRPSMEEMELCEEYTCVISHVGDNQIKKREYFDDGGFLENKNFVINGSVKVSANSFRLVSASSAVSRGGEMETFQMADFLNSCFLCKKQLHGLDIFMYRGEKAFCSAECRCKQIALDEHKEKCVSGARKPHEYSASPVMQFFAGVAAA